MRYLFLLFAITNCQQQTQVIQPAPQRAFGPPMQFFQLAPVSWPSLPSKLDLTNLQALFIEGKGPTFSLMGLKETHETVDQNIDTLIAWHLNGKKLYLITKSQCPLSSINLASGKVVCIDHRLLSMTLGAKIFEDQQGFIYYQAAFGGYQHIFKKRPSTNPETLFSHPVIQKFAVNKHGEVLVNIPEEAILFKDGHYRETKKSMTMSFLGVLPDGAFFFDAIRDGTRSLFKLKANSANEKLLVHLESRTLTFAPHNPVAFIGNTLYACLNNQGTHRVYQLKPHFQQIEPLKDAPCESLDATAEELIVHSSSDLLYKPSDDSTNDMHAVFMNDHAVKVIDIVDNNLILKQEIDNEVILSRYTSEPASFHTFNVNTQKMRFFKLLSP